MSDEFQYQRKPIFNIGDRILGVFHMHNLTDESSHLVFEAEISQIKIIATCNGEHQNYEFKYKLSIPGEWHEPTVNEDDIFSLDDREHAEGLAIYRAEMALRSMEGKLARTKAILKNIGIEK
ncbi:hypothetical protein [Vibrio parahaemolyticus]|uniref:hypothetical protein n=1 Tax=Vibrio parahaemolyticus TaxID=670 RepID=UPI0030049A9A